MNTKLRLSDNMKGLVTLHYTGKKDYFFQVRNAIQPSAIEIVTGRLADLPSYKIDYIKVFEGGVLKSARSIAMTSKVSTNEVEFFTTFTQLDFNGDFDEIQLVCDAVGIFAKVTGLTQTKPADEQLAITWKIKIV